MDDATDDPALCRVIVTEDPDATWRPSYSPDPGVIFVLPDTFASDEVSATVAIVVLSSINETTVAVECVEFPRCAWKLVTIQSSPAGTTTPPSVIAEVELLGC
jgi:hypothetical protein